MNATLECMVIFASVGILSIDGQSEWRSVYLKTAVAQILNFYVMYFYCADVGLLAVFNNQKFTHWLLVVRNAY